MIVSKKEQGYYCTRCQTTYGLFQNIPKECYFGECTPTMSEIVEKNCDNVKDKKLSKIDYNDLNGTPELKEG